MTGSTAGADVRESGGVALAGTAMDAGWLVGCAADEVEAAGVAEAMDAAGAAGSEDEGWGAEAGVAAGAGAEAIGTGGARAGSLVAGTACVGGGLPVRLPWGRYQ